jgi:hypothetical protein
MEVQVSTPFMTRPNIGLALVDCETLPRRRRQHHIHCNGNTSWRIQMKISRWQGGREMRFESTMTNASAGHGNIITRCTSPGALRTILLASLDLAWLVARVRPDVVLGLVWEFLGYSAHFRMNDVQSHAICTSLPYPGSAKRDGPKWRLHAECQTFHSTSIRP